MVRIQTSSGSGSGVIFETQGRTGYVVTNHHVVEGEVQVSVIVNDSTTYRGSVLGTDSVRDLAVLSICCGSFQALPFGNAANLQPGDEVVAIGYALGLPGEATVTRGIVSAVRYDSAYRSNVIQTDAAINPGNSGGPMLSLSGEILGINTFRYDESQSGRPTEGLGFAISGTTVQQQIPTLLAGGIPLGRASKGNTLIISVQDIKRVQEIRYLGGNGLHYLVSPSDPEKQLVALLLIIHNQDAARVIITVDEKAAELRGEGPDDRYGVVDVSPENERNVRVVGETHPSENLLAPFIVGSIEKDGVPGLPQGHSVEGWVVFEAPEGIRLTALRWVAGDIVLTGERAGPSAPTPTPSPTPAPTPTPTLLTIHNTQNMRWLAQSHPSLYRQIEELPWVQDAISEVERDAIDQLLYIAVADTQSLAATLGLPWVRDAISEVERDALDQLSGIGYSDSQSLAATLSLPWVRDAISEVERDALDQLSGIGYSDSQSLAATLGLPWVRDAISEVERDALDQLSGIGYSDSQSLAATLSLPWVQDAISAVEYDAVYWIRVISYYDGKVAAAIIPMPFLWVPDVTDVLALRSIHALASRGVLAPLLEHPTFLDGIAEGETTLVTAVGTLYSDIEEISRMLDPGYASIESVAIETDLTPHLPINIIRAGSEPTRWAADAMAGAVETEGAMLVSLPIDHLILVLNDKAVAKNYAGVNYGFAFSFLPEYEQKQDTFEGQAFLRGIVHEVAHYYWRGNEGWIDEGLANTIEYMHGIENGLSPGQLKTKREDCEAHDLEMLSEWDPPTSSLAEYHCNYYLGELLFLELRESMDDAAFSEKLRDLYQLTLMEQAAGPYPGIAVVRQVFTDQASIVDKHWSGALNAPENRPFDEGA